MKKLTNALWLFAIGWWLMASCAEGYETSSTADLGVFNTKMETPIQDSISFKVSSDGKSATICWPTVGGAGGHEVTFMNVDDPDNPVVIDGYDKKIVDGSKFTVSVAEDCKYQMLMRTLGKKEFGNTDDEVTHTYNFTTLVPSVAKIPSGTDIYEYFQANPLDSNKAEVAIDLEAGGEYTLSGTVDFSHHKLTFRGDKIHRPVVHMTGDGHFETYSTLKVKFINFDMTESTAGGFIAMSKDNLPDSIKTENRGNYWRGSSQIKGIYMVEDPIYIANCWFKNLPHAMLYHNNINCAFWYFTLSNCIVQMNNVTKSNIGFINLYDSGANGKSVKNITIEKSTIYNIADNSSACFIRYGNESNSNPEKVFGNISAEYNSHTWTFTRSTLAKCYYSDETHSGWRFCNNVRVSSAFTLNIDHTIFYNCAQLYRMNGGSKTFRFNFFWNDGEDDKSRNNSIKDSGNAPFAFECDPGFGGDNVGQIAKELDFSQPNGGVNFTPTMYDIIANRGGDPRWLPATDEEIEN
jgi:hypothetical protein